AKLRSLSGENVDLKSIGSPQNDGERLAYAEALLAQNKFAEAQDQMSQVTNRVNNAGQAFAVADLALMIHDLDSATQASNKATTCRGGEERSKRGLAAVTRARESARQDLTLANDLSRRKQLASAVDKYHSAIFANPRVPDARLALGQTLEKMKPSKASD